MQNIFLKVLSMGADACWIILAVMFLRIVFCKAPKWIICFLWILAGLRLICPFNIESPVCFIPQAAFSSGIKSNIINGGNGNISPVKDNKFSIVKNGQENGIHNIYKNNKGGENIAEGRHKTPVVINGITGSKNDIISVLTVIWIAGMSVLLLYLIINYIYIKKRLSFATRLYGNVWECENAGTPFIFGILRPGIYIPYHMDKSQLSCILAHEYAHIKRKDHILKAAAFVILSVYWFHPLVWAAYILLCRDIEFACDEKAVLSMDMQEKKDYLLALLNCSTERSNGTYPLAFGRIRIKERVVHVKKLKKPSFILTVITLFAGIVILAGFLTSPQGQKAEGNVPEDTNNDMAGNTETKGVSPEDKTELAGYYVAKAGNDDKAFLRPDLVLDTDKKTFSFSYDVLSSYLSMGTYTEDNNKVKLTTDDGKFHYTFQKDKENNLYFLADKSSSVNLIDNRFGIEIKDGMVFEPSDKKSGIYDDFVVFETRQANVDLNGNSGADGAILYYVSTDKIIFGGYFGLFVYNKASGEIEQSLDLEYIGCNYTQGDNYCTIAASTDGSRVYMKPLKKNKLYVFNVLSGILEMKYYNGSIWKDSSLDLFHTEGYQAKYYDGKTEKTCRLRESNGLIGGCQYFEYEGKGPEYEKDITYYPLFKQ